MQQFSNAATALCFHRVPLYISVKPRGSLLQSLAEPENHVALIQTKSSLSAHAVDEPASKFHFIWNDMVNPLRALVLTLPLHN